MFWSRHIYLYTHISYNFLATLLLPQHPLQLISLTAFRNGSQTVKSGSIPILQLLDWTMDGPSEHWGDFCWGLLGKKVCFFSWGVYKKKKKKISPWLDRSEEVCSGGDYCWQSSWHHADNSAKDKLMLWKAEWKEIRPWWLYQPDQTSCEALPPWTILLFEPTDSVYCLSPFNLRFLWLATWNITSPNWYYCFRA